MSPVFRRRLVEPPRSPRSLDRRSALVAGLAAAIGALGGALGGYLDRLVSRSRPALASAVAPGGYRTTSRAVIEPSQEHRRWVDTGLQLTDMAEGTPYRVSAGAIGAFVVRQGSGVTAMSSLCTHMACELVWVPNERLLSCPCRNLTFDVGGQPRPPGGYMFPALPLVAVRVAGGRVKVLGT